MSDKPLSERMTTYLVECEKAGERAPYGLVGAWSREVRALEAEREELRKVITDLRELEALAGRKGEAVAWRVGVDPSDDRMTAHLFNTRAEADAYRARLCEGAGPGFLAALLPVTPLYTHSALSRERGALAKLRECAGEEDEVILEVCGGTVE